MRRFLKVNRLVPALLVSAAIGLSIAGNDTSAVAAESPKTEAPPITEERRSIKAPVGSGRENYAPFDRVNDSGVPANVEDYGEQLYIQGCSSCHGLNLEGTAGVPTLIGSGAAAVDFYVSSGRMPAETIYNQAPRKAPVYNREQIDALAAYVSQYGGGPAIPTIDVEAGNLVEGQELFATNCAACHNSNGSGGALSDGYYAPPLHQASPLQVAEAIRVGPGAMPVYGPGTFTDQQVNSILKYVEALDNADNPGGLPLGSLGPVPEGFFAWIVGLGLLLAVARWIGTRV